MTPNEARAALIAAGLRLAGARAVSNASMEIVKEAVADALQAGLSEVECARLAEVNRSTVRAVSARLSNSNL